MSVLTLCVSNTSVFSVPRQSSPKERRRPGQPECQTCLSRRRRLKSRQPPPKPPFPWTRRLKPLPRPPRQRPKRQLIRRRPAQPHQLTTRTEYVEPGRRTVLAKCSAKGELLQPHRVNLDLSSYTDLSIGELVSGYISQVHKSRDAEIAMVNQIQQKSEVTFYCFLISA